MTAAGSGMQKWNASADLLPSVTWRDLRYRPQAQCSCADRDGAADRVCVGADDTRASSNQSQYGLSVVTLIAAVLLIGRIK
jgi:hypothetical protein